MVRLLLHESSIDLLLRLLKQAIQSLMLRRLSCLEIIRLLEGITRHVLSHTAAKHIRQIVRIHLLYLLHLELLLQLILLHLQLMLKLILLLLTLLLLKELLDLEMHRAGYLVLEEAFGCDIELLLAEATRLPGVLYWCLTGPGSRRGSAGGGCGGRGRLLLRALEEGLNELHIIAHVAAAKLLLLLGRLLTSMVGRLIHVVAGATLRRARRRSRYRSRNVLAVRRIRTIHSSRKVEGECAVAVV